MPRKPTPPPPELDRVREIADQIEELQRELRRAMVTAKQAGATSQQLADASRIARSKIYDAMRTVGYDPNEWRSP
ncbi:hypothetical protein [Prauserella flavalba]|uniref:Uncharacterized protein n=1 Tax=Prauserella flavalba TaxID=1477506 RepID=A0A318L8X5_9PSEU|nr:hypothetical protein [Prauserella flavalba]PXY17357.1 hypothetical protein BA062_37745 [Prauserella flavalba]